MPRLRARRSPRPGGRGSHRRVVAGGPTTMENLQALCMACNRRKGIREGVAEEDGPQRWPPGQRRCAAGRSGRWDRAQTLPGPSSSRRARRREDALRPGMRSPPVCRTRSSTAFSSSCRPTRLVDQWIEAGRGRRRSGRPPGAGGMASHAASVPALGRGRVHLPRPLFPHDDVPGARGRARVQDTGDLRRRFTTPGPGAAGASRPSRPSWPRRPAS